MPWLWVLSWLWIWSPCVQFLFPKRPSAASRTSTLSSCKEMIVYAEPRSNQERYCGFIPMRCPMPGCNQEGLKDLLSRHWLEKHKVSSLVDIIEEDEDYGAYCYSHCDRILAAHGVHPRNASYQHLYRCTNRVKLKAACVAPVLVVEQRTRSWSGLHICIVIDVVDRYQVSFLFILLRCVPWPSL